MVYDWKNKIKKVKVMFEMVHIWIIALFLAIGLNANSPRHFLPSIVLIISLSLKALCLLHLIISFFFWIKTFDTIDASNIIAELICVTACERLNAKYFPIANQTEVTKLSVSFRVTCDSKGLFCFNPSRHQLKCQIAIECFALSLKSWCWLPWQRQNVRSGWLKNETPFCSHEHASFSRNLLRNILCSS